jgi:hypothetical protein
MNAQETIDYWIGATAAHETTIASLLEERAKLQRDLEVARNYVRTEWKAGRLQGAMSDEEIRVFQENAKDHTSP